MTDTPIIDAARQAYVDAVGPRFIVVLRAMLPWEPSQDWIDAVTNWGRAISTEQAIAVWRRQPIMRELYPERFR